MTTIHITSQHPITVRTYEHQSTRATTQNVEQQYVAKENGVEYRTEIEYIGPSKDDPDVV